MMNLHVKQNDFRPSLIQSTLLLSFHDIRKALEYHLMWIMHMITETLLFASFEKCMTIVKRIIRWCWPRPCMPMLASRSQTHLTEYQGMTGALCIRHYRQGLSSTFEPANATQTNANYRGIIWSSRHNKFVPVPPFINVQKKPIYGFAHPQQLALNRRRQPGGRAFQPLSRWRRY